MKLRTWIEVEHVEAALKLVSRGVCETFVSKAVANSPLCPPGVHTTTFAEPLFDTVALIKRDDTVLSPATEELVRLALQILRRNPALERMPAPR